MTTLQVVLVDVVLFVALVVLVVGVIVSRRRHS